MPTETQKKPKRKIEWAQLILLLLFLLVDALVLANILQKKQRAVLGTASRRWLLLMLLTVNVSVAGVCLLYRRLAKKMGKWGTAALAVFSPVLGFVLLEILTGNLPLLPHVAVALNLALAFLLLLLVLLFFTNVRTALLFYNVWMPLLGTVQYYVYKFRGRPFMLADISSAWTAARVAAGYSYELDLIKGSALLVMLGLLFLCACSPKFRIRRLSIVRKAAALAAFAAGIWFLCTPSLVAQHRIFAMDMWDLLENYRSKGFLLNVASQLQYVRHAKPENYSVEAVQEIAETYSAAYDEKHKDDAPAVQPVNLIMVMNESWADFREFENFRCDDEIIDFIDSLEDNVTKGWVSVPTFGGLTANTEYEVLTGNSMYLIGGNGSVAYQVYHQETEYGLASALEAQGYRPVAMHPEVQKNFNRAAVYPSMGFDEFYSWGLWPKKYRKKERNRVVDLACYQFLEQLDRERNAQEKDFTFLITMQNHGGYTNADYKSTVDLDYEEEYKEAEQYLSLIRETDDAFEQLIGYFREVPEPTMIVMFGDHLPNLQDGFFDMLREGQEENLAQYERQRYSTPFVIWTNYERESESGVTMSANYFGSYVMELAGAELTDYQKFAMEARDQMPVIRGGEVMLSDGTWHSTAELDAPYAELLNDYQILQYNNMFGKEKRRTEVFSLE